MKHRTFVTALVSLGVLSTSLRAAEPLAFTVQTGKPVQRIDARIYGQFLEHIFNSVHGGLWGDQVLNGTLEEDPARKGQKIDPAHAPRDWEFAGKGIRADKSDPLNAEWSVHLQSGAETKEGPALQQHHVALRAKEHYTLSLYARGSARLAIRFSSGEQVLLTKEISGLTEKWQKFTVTFTAPQEADDATLAISLQGAGEANVDEVSLFSAAALANHKLRPDLYQAVAALKPATIRWPGGGYANHYLWESGVGPAEKRLPLASVEWNDRDPNAFGTDEFLQMCERLHAEPILVLNINQPLADSLHWLHYCMDDASTEWGQRRAANGHAAPYHLHTIEIGNEAWLMMKYPRYLEIVKEFAPALRKEFPSLQLSVCGSYAYDTGPGEGTPENANWDARILQDAGDLFDILSPHYYNGLLKQNPPDYVNDPRQYEKFLESRAELIKHCPNPHIKLYVSEWNLTHGAWGNDWRVGLYAGGILNAFERDANIVHLSCPALFLRKVTARSWNNALINFSTTGWFPAGNYVVMKLWRDNFAPNLLQLEGPDHPLNAVATESEDHRAVYLKVVNPEKSAAEATFTLAGFSPGNATMQLIAPGSETARNSLADPTVIKPVETPVDLHGNQLHVTFPPLSAGVIKVTR